ncbi:MAG: hypothetical protein HY821_22845 [Acidobacteria bacterium]|nr:hypothetical protein [Acidobacteriota bacterium]
MSTSFTLIALSILACLPGAAPGAEAFQDGPPPELVKQVAAREAASEQARGNYMYRQEVRVEEYGGRSGSASGFYKELREVIFTPEGKRLEQMVGRPEAHLSRLILTDEDFEDLRNIQPLLLTPEMLPRYTVKFRGEETVEGKDCWVLQIDPRQLLQGMRLFEGMAWVEKTSLQIVRTEGQAVPPVYHGGKENLFPRFVTVREKVDGFYFPALTYADDVLPFKTGPLRMKLRVKYSGYQKFGAESKITFEPRQ